ncbi:hypothetical protein E4U19_003867 [Claviceps sp. Clav32 group G5]|nr:hypothetical protein E4U19_003867 [Claviceps sp. Clav32 group G5]
MAMTLVRPLGMDGWALLAPEGFYTDPGPAVASAELSPFLKRKRVGMTNSRGGWDDDFCKSLTWPSECRNVVGRWLKDCNTEAIIRASLAANLVYALEIWTQVFIRSLAAQSGEPDVAAEIASVLCASDDNKDNSNHDAGPNDIVGTFESLFYTGETEEEIQDITSRTRQLAAVFCIDKEYQGLRRLEEDHPLKPLLQETHTWCREEYQLMQEAEKEDS